jgi:hypothetical protein
MQASLLQRRDFGTREHFARIGDAEWVKRGAQTSEAIDFLAREHRWQEIAFFDADSMLSSYRASHLDAHVQDSAGKLFCLFQRAWLPAIKQNQGVQVAIPGVKNIRAPQTGLSRHLADPAQRFTQPPSRNNPILDNEVGRKAADSAKGVLAAFPNSQALAGIPRGTNAQSAAFGQNLVQTNAIYLHHFLWAFKLDD